MENEKRRRWLILASAGYALVLIAIAIVCLAMFAKEQFSWLVGSAFLPSIGFLIFGGAGALLLAVMCLPQRKSWRSLTVAAWSVVALTSPLFGLMFLLPWSVLLLSSPLVFAILLHWFRGLVSSV